MRWVIGDIHGMLSALDALLERIYKRDRDASLLFCGDYINRGPASCGVIDRLLTQPRARFVRGNHDDVFDLILSGGCRVTEFPPDVPTGELAATAAKWFIDQGLRETLQSYGLPRDRIDSMIVARPNGLIEQVRELVPDSHKKFFRDLPLTIDDDDLMVVHAHWPLEKANTPDRVAMAHRNLEHRYDSVWLRYAPEQLKSPHRWTRRIFVGPYPHFELRHQHAHRPPARRNRQAGAPRHRLRRRPQRPPDGLLRRGETLHPGRSRRRRDLNFQAEHPARPITLHHVRDVELQPRVPRRSCCSQS